MEGVLAQLTQWRWSELASVGLRFWIERPRGCQAQIASALQQCSGLALPGSQVHSEIVFLLGLVLVAFTLGRLTSDWEVSELLRRNRREFFVGDGPSRFSVGESRRPPPGRARRRGRMA